MYYVGIDISKYKHDCFICTETGEIIEENLSFTNTNEGFIQLLNLLKSLDNSQEIRIGFEATGHYGMNLKLFLEKNNYSFMEFNPAFQLKLLEELKQIRKMPCSLLSILYLWITNPIQNNFITNIH